MTNEKRVRLLYRYFLGSDNSENALLDVRIFGIFPVEMPARGG